MKIINNKAKNLTILTFLLALTLTPALGFAKDNDKKDRDDDKNKCVKAWGQFVKNGWKENKGNISISSDCRIPNGIFKKWNYNKATSTDTTAPTISNILTTINLNKLFISWKTDELAKSKLFYGTTTLNIAATTTTGIEKNTFVKNHSFELPSMSSTTPYHIILQSTDAVGNVRTSGEYVIYSPF